MKKLSKLLSAVLACLMVFGVLGTANVSASVFPDMTDSSREEAVETLYALGIMVGDKDTGLFRPDDAIKRSEVAKIASVLYLASTLSFRLRQVEQFWKGIVPLLIVPGIMKSFSYQMVPYILSEDPDIEPKEALNRSEAMMAGHRWELFVLDLSFFGWIMLSIITLGLGYIFYVGPYMNATYAEFYQALKETEQY